MKNLKTLAKSVCKVTLLAGMVLATTMSFAQNIQKAGSGSSLYLEKGGKKIGNETFEKIAGYNAKADLIPAKLNGKWGFYNNDGKLVLPHQYSLLFFGDPDCWYVGSLIQVELNGTKIWIDKTGKQSADDYKGFKYIPAILSKRYYYIEDKNGNQALADEEKILTPFIYGMIQPKSNNPITFNAIPKDGSSSGGKVVTLDENGQDLGAVKHNLYVCEFCGDRVNSDAPPKSGKSCKAKASGIHKYVKQD